MGEAVKWVKGIIFDCDGVLFESRNANLAFYNKILTAFGRDEVASENKEEAHLCHTAASQDVFAYFFGESMLDEVIAFARSMSYRQFIPYMQPEPALFSCLARLSSEYPLAVATNRNVSMQEILDHFDLRKYFSTVVTSQDVARPKPAPDMLIKAAEQLGMQHDELLFIGDSEYDQQAALGAGIKFAAYKNDLVADYSLNSHQELVDLLNCS